MVGKKTLSNAPVAKCKQLVIGLFPYKFFRFVQNFQTKSGGALSVSDIQEVYDKQRDRVNFNLDQSMIGRIVNDVFGNAVEICRPRIKISNDRSIEDMRIVSYLNLAVREDASHTGSNGLNMENLSDGLKLGDWTVKGKSDRDEVRLWKISSDLYVNKREYSPEVVVNLTERTFVARGINGTENNNVDLCFPSENVSIDSIPIIVDFLDSLGICTGFELSEEPDVVPRYHDRLFQLETICGEHCTKTMLSSECKVFSGKAGFCCSSCAKLRKSVLRECKRANEGQKGPSAVLHTKNKCLSRQELQLKCEILKNQRVNANRRANYSASQFDRETLEVCGEDHQDFAALMKGIEPDMLPDDMKLLFEQQQMALSRKSHGFRWHPK